MLDIKSYLKPTNNFQYLHRESAHPKSVFKGFIKGECYRLMRNTSDKDLLEGTLHSFKEKLIQRGYHENEILPIMQEVSRKNRTALLKPGLKSPKNDTTILVTKFDPRIKGIKKRILKNWKLISDDLFLKTIFKSAPMIAYEKHKNLSEILTSSKMN